MTVDEAKLRPLSPREADLADEYRMVQEWVGSLKDIERAAHETMDLKSWPSGKVIFEADADRSVKLMRAALEITNHYDLEFSRLLAVKPRPVPEHAELHLANVWRRQAASVVATLLRRTLALEERDVLSLAEWYNEGEPRLRCISEARLVRAVEFLLESRPLSPQLRAALERLAGRFRVNYDKSVRALAMAVEAIYASDPTKASEPRGAPEELKPAMVGHPGVLTRLKKHLDVMPAETMEIPANPHGPDSFPLRDDSPLRAEHQLISELIQSPDSWALDYWKSKPKMESVLWKQIQALSARERGRLYLAACERDVHRLFDRARTTDTNQVWRLALAEALPQWFQQLGCDFDGDDVYEVSLYLGTRSAHAHANFTPTVDVVTKCAAADAVDGVLHDAGRRYALKVLRTSLFSAPPMGNSPERAARLTKVLGDRAVFYFTPGDEWADAANRDLAVLPEASFEAWIKLLRHAATATTARPTAKWLSAAAKLLEAIGEESLQTKLAVWLRSFPKGRSFRLLPGPVGDRGDEVNATMLRGLLWVSTLFRARDDAWLRDVAGVAAATYKKVPGVGPRTAKVGNAAIFVLAGAGTAGAVGQLAMLKVRIKVVSAQKEVEKAFDAAAQTLGLPREQIEELGVPTYGMEEVGVRRETFDEAQAVLRVDGRDVTIQWSKGGKSVKSVPASVKENFKDDLKELQGSAKDIAAMLPAQTERFEGMFLLQKQWPMQIWRERYLDHPLMGTLARRLIWLFRKGETARAAIWLNGALVDAADQPVATSNDTSVELWHPIGRAVDEIVAWRQWMERHEVRQPFKQAHREVYVLTDAERRTQTYSNRFAAHIVRQHQFNALCHARGWKNTLRLMVDSSYPPASRQLPAWGLRAEFWIEGVGDNYHRDATESGSYLRLASDQVRFYRTDAAQAYAHAGGGGYEVHRTRPDAGGADPDMPLALDTIPPLVLSEVMRDVDLFVGVASIGNDPTWQDGGPDGHFRDYWASYSFGELGEQAKTRKQLLANLLPRLTKIRDRCLLTERFLVVRGDLRTYKIHLGSGNILMEPNDQYLCIVMDSAARAGSSAVFLPFEGDNTLAIILSKAFLLAADKKITDPTITRQIGG